MKVRPVLLVGAAVVAGFAVAYFGAGAGLRELTLSRLDNVAAQLVLQGYSVAAEVDTVLDDAAAISFPPCSDKDLDALRSLVFGARYVRDVGRVKDGYLACTSGVGRLRPADHPQRKADATTRSGNQLFANAGLVSAPGRHALVVQRNEINAVIDPRAFDHVLVAPTRYSIVILGDNDERVVRAFGDDLRLSAAQLRAGGRMARGGQLFSSICIAAADVCAITGIAADEAAKAEQPMALAFGALGALAGACAGIAGVFALRRRQELPAQLRRCLQRDELTLVYQPIVDLQTGRMVSAEALVRWHLQDGKPVRPDIFVALAEEMGLITQITGCVIRKSAAELGDMLKRHEFRVGINIAAADLEDTTLPDKLKQSFMDKGVPVSCVSLELTERSTAARASAIAAIARLRAGGHKVAIDDFGTGYSSLSYLHELAVDAIKLDKSFTDTIGTEAVTASVVPQILDMAAALKLGVIVEGVETEEQEAYLRIAGVRYVQGWRYGKPMPAVDLAVRLEAERRSRAADAAVRRVHA